MQQLPPNNRQIYKIFYAKPLNLSATLILIMRVKLKSSEKPLLNQILQTLLIVADIYICNISKM